MFWQDYSQTHSLTVFFCVVFLIIGEELVVLYLSGE